MNEKKINSYLIEKIEDFNLDQEIPDYFSEEFEEFYEGIGREMLKGLLPKKVLHGLKRAAHKERYKMGIKLYYQIKNDKSRKMSDGLALATAAELVGLNPREFAKILDKETRYESAELEEIALESNQNGQVYREPSVKPTGKVLEDGLPETTKAYCDMTPGQTYDQIMNIISEKAPPDKDIETWLKKNKQRFIDQYGEEDYAEYLYGRAWNMYNKKHGKVESNNKKFKEFMKNGV